MKELGEFEIIEAFFSSDGADDSVLVGIGDDAAVLDVESITESALAVTVDTLVEGVHFPAGLDAGDVGHRALAVNLSDLAAMGARPQWWTLALTLPSADRGWLEAFSRAARALAREHGATLIGGDLTRGPLALSVQLIGTVPRDACLRRDGAAAGDDIYVTGFVGDAMAGLGLLEAQGKRGREQPGTAAARLIERFRRPVPRVAAGVALRNLASAAIDVSDGLLADLGHVCAASRVAAEIDLGSLPVSAELLEVLGEGEATKLALNGGDDYELCFTLPPGLAEEALARLAGLDVPARRIGRMAEGSGLRVTRDGKAVDVEHEGYTHFRS